MEQLRSKRTATAKKPQVVYVLGSAYSKTVWPVISRESQEDILDMLCRLLSPVGDYRSTVNRSKGKRAKKRKRPNHGSASEAEQIQATRSIYPDLINFVSIGFNSTTRHLETLAQKATPSSLLVDKTDAVTARKPSASQKIGQSGAHVSRQKPLLAVFVPCMKESSNLYSHLPILVKTASMAFPHLPAIRLVTLPMDAEKRLSEALKIPRVGLIGFECDAPGVSALAEMIRANVPELIVPWLQESKAGVYLPTDIKAIYPNPFLDQESRAEQKT